MLNEYNQELNIVHTDDGRYVFLVDGCEYIETTNFGDMQNFCYEQKLNMRKLMSEN